MKVIIAGGREITDVQEVAHALGSVAMLSVQEVTEIVSGTARGVDRLGEEIAKMHKIPVKRFPADWNKHGKSAGHKRNLEMAKYD